MGAPFIENMKLLLKGWSPDKLGILTLFDLKPFLYEGQ